MRIISFNVNGLRSIKDYYAVTKQWSFDDFLDSFDADIICMQEVKANEANRLDQQMLTPSNYHAYYAFHRPNSVKRIGYAGVATFCRKSSKDWLPRNYEEGFTGTIPISIEDNRIGTIPEWEEEIFIDLDTLKLLDSEARCIITDHGKFILMNVYFPNDSGEPERDYFRSFFYSVVFKRAQLLVREGFNVIIAGDINITYHPRDHCEYTKIYKENPEALEQAIHHDKGPLKEFYDSKPLRKWIYKEISINKSCIDPFRILHPEDLNQYTCWSTLLSTRAHNYGTRIDYFLCFGSLFSINSLNEIEIEKYKNQICNHNSIFKECNLMTNILGSDHCPIFLDLDFDPISPMQSHIDNDSGDNSKEPKIKIQQYRFKQIESFFKRENKEENKKELETPHRTRDAFISKKTPISPFHSLDLKNKTINVDEENFPSSTSSFTESLYFGKPLIPNCIGHNLPCIIQTVRKLGPNKGRQFWTCSKPVGNQGDPEAKCKYFKWKNVKNK